MPIVDREWAVAREDMSVFSKAVNMCGKEMEIVTKAAAHAGKTATLNTGGSVVWF